MARPADIKMHPNFRAKLSQLPSVRAKTRAVAQRGADYANQIAAAEDYEVHAKVEEGIRPDGRSFARIVSNDIDQEFGTWVTKRRRILGRALQRLAS